MNLILTLSVYSSVFQNLNITSMKKFSLLILVQEDGFTSVQRWSVAANSRKQAVMACEQAYKIRAITVRVVKKKDGFALSERHFSASPCPCDKYKMAIPSYR
jgi:hypothetical protein